MHFNVDNNLFYVIIQNGKNWLCKFRKLQHLVTLCHYSKLYHIGIGMFRDVISVVHCSWDVLTSGPMWMVPRTIFLPNFVFVATVDCEILIILRLWILIGKVYFLHTLIRTFSKPSSLTSGMSIVESAGSQRADSVGANGSLRHESDKMSCSKTVVFT